MHEAEGILVGVLFVPIPALTVGLRFMVPVEQVQPGCIHGRRGQANLQVLVALPAAALAAVWLETLHGDPDRSAFVAAHADGAEEERTEFPVTPVHQVLVLLRFQERRVGVFGDRLPVGEVVAGMGIGHDLLKHAHSRMMPDRARPGNPAEIRGGNGALRGERSAGRRRACTAAPSPQGRNVFTGATHVNST